MDYNAKQDINDYKITCQYYIIYYNEIFVGTFVGTKLNSVYIISNQTACNSPPKRRESAEFLTKMSQKAPFSLITAAGNSITAKKRGAPGTHGAVGCPRRVRLDKSKIQPKAPNSHLYKHK